MPPNPSPSTPQPSTPPDIAQAYAEFVSAYQNNPVAFVKNVLRANPLPWQVELLTLVAKGERRISVRAGHGVGKALHVEEPVLTPAGWQAIGNINVGDKVATVDGSFTDVIGVYPQGRRELYRVILSDGCSVVVDGDHRWTTTTRSERKHGKPSGVRTTKEIANSLTFSNGVRSGLNHMIPTVLPVRHPRAVLPVDPYLMGVWLGDGASDGRITAGEEIIQQVAVSGERWMTLTKVKHSEKVVIGGCENLRPRLRNLGILWKRAHEKSVPRSYMHGSIEQRSAVLQGLLDTDGTVGKNNAVVFDVVSKDLADDVAELVRSLGGVARRSERDGKYKGKVCRRVYRVFISLPEGISPFRLASKVARYKPNWRHKNRQTTLCRFIKSVEPVGVDEAVCISVAHESQLFVTRDHIVTHNSTCCSWLLLWQLCTRLPQKSVCTAPTASQLFDALFSELKHWANQLPPALRDTLEIFSDRIVHKGAPESSFISARTSSAERPESLAGIHSESVLLIVDEASAIPEAVFESAAGSMSGHSATTILIGNPTRNTGMFFRTHHQLSSDWKTMHVSCRDNPLVSEDFINQISSTYGENSNAFRVRVLGEFSLRDDDSLIAADLVDAAMSRDIVLDETQDLVFGVDVARFGSDRTVLCKRRGNVVTEIRHWSGEDLMGTVGRILHEAKVDKPAMIAVDSIGLGAGVSDRLRELQRENKELRLTSIVDVNVSESNSMNQQAAKLRDELWLAAKDWLETRAVKLPRDDDLRQELVGPTYSFTSNGKIKVEGKADMKRRGMRSPDIADSLCLTFAHGAAIVGGRVPRWIPGEPLRRNISIC